MATIPFIPAGSQRRREPLTGARLIIVSVAIGFALFLVWAMLAQVDEVTAGQGKVIPSSKVQIIQSTEPATIAELMVRSGQQVKRGQLLARLDSPESRSIQAETEALQARSARLQSEGTGSALSLGGDEATLSAVRRQALSSRVAPSSAAARAPKRRRRSVRSRAAWPWHRTM
jgi:membrane fusion protein, adhesin transport system